MTLEPAATLDRVRTWLFSPEQPPQAPPDAELLFSAPGESLECVEIARRIRALAEQGTPFDRIAILLRNVEQYQPLVEEALRRAAIPGYFSRGAARPDPAGRAFLALLACASDRLLRLRASPNTCRWDSSRPSIKTARPLNGLRSGFHPTTMCLRISNRPARPRDSTRSIVNRR